MTRSPLAFANADSVPHRRHPHRPRRPVGGDGHRSAIVFETPLLWDARIDVDRSLLPLLGVMAVERWSVFATASMSGHGVPGRPYGRLLMIVAGTFLLTTTTSFMVRSLPYSRLYVPLVLAIWTVLERAPHLRRRRPGPSARGGDIGEGSSTSWPRARTSRSVRVIDLRPKKS